MARIFTTSFVFNQKRYDAIVTVLTHQEQLNFHIKVLDADLHEILPDGEISYSGIKGFEQHHSLDSAFAQSFMRSISGAIEKHLATDKYQL